MNLAFYLTYGIEKYGSRYVKEEIKDYLTMKLE
jgi:hypothetical protein